MTEQMLSKLGDDKVVLYEGCTENIKAMDATHKKGNILRICILMAIAVIISVAYCIKFEEPKIGLVAIIDVLFAYAACSDILNASKLKKMNYYLTEKHIVSGNESTNSVVPFSAIKEYEFRTDEDGNNYLVCGKVKGGMYGLRSKALIPCKVSEEGTIDSLVIYAMSDFENFKKIFEAQMSK